MKPLRLGRIFGVPLEVHWSFFIALGLVLIQAADSRPGRGGPMVTILCLAVAALILHEFGHALAARLFRVRVGSILLHVFGGVTRLEAGPLRGWREVPVALGGPLVNLALGLFALAPPGNLRLFGVINLVFGGINLLPIWPLDGGRILRAHLARTMPRLKASLLTVVMGTVLLVVAAIWSIFQVGLLGPVCAIYLGITGWRAFQADLIQDLTASTSHLFQGGEAEGAPQEEPEPEEGPDQEASLAEELSSFRGNMAEFLARKREGEGKK